MRQQLCLFVLISFLGGVIAPACGFLWGGKYSLVEICTSQGIEQRLVADADVPASGDHDKNPLAGDNCEFCFQNAHSATHLSTAPVFKKTAFYSTKIRFDLYEDILLSRTRTAASARGPPHFV